MRPEQRRLEVLQLNNTEAVNEQLINDLIGAMIDLDFIQFENLLVKHISQHDIFSTVSSIVFQFLEKVCFLWQSNRIHPAQ